VFANLSNNPLFLVIIGVIICLQIVLVTFAGMAFGVYPYYGLHPIHWLISVDSFFIQIAFGLLSLANSVFLKLLPSKWFP